MKDQLHLIITGATGQGRSLVLSRKRLKLGLTLSALLLCLLVAGTSLTSRSLKQQRLLAAEVQQLSQELGELTETKAAYAERIMDLEAINIAQAETFAAEKEELLNSTVNQLNQRSQLIETVMSNIGVPIEQQDEAQANSGGPYLPPAEEYFSHLLNRSDQYLETIRSIPLGWPHRGKVTSRFGDRSDPFLKQKGFHAGIDLRGKRGQEVRATADGLVTRASRFGSYGLYVEIDHNNGYTTGFAHLKKYLVKKGDTVHRGQVIGLLGNSGRSTGPHLHYEIKQQGKPVNPYKYMSTLALAKPIIPVELGPRAVKKIHQPTEQ